MPIKSATTLVWVRYRLPWRLQQEIGREEAAVDCCGRRQICMYLCPC